MTHRPKPVILINKTWSAKSRQLIRFPQVLGPISGLYYATVLEENGSCRCPKTKQDRLVDRTACKVPARHSRPSPGNFQLSRSFISHKLPFRISLQQGHADRYSDQSVCCGTDELLVSTGHQDWVRFTGQPGPTCLEDVTQPLASITT